MSPKAYLYILKGGLFLAFISFFLVSRNLLFPYISTKQIYFNVLMEILAVFWLALIFKYPEWRPKKSLITIGLAAYFLAVLISSFFGIDFNLSFWGDVERMLGFFHIFHFFIFYLILITVVKEKKDWLYLFGASLMAAVIVSLYSFKINHSTIGNSAYVSGLLVFNIFFALILFANAKNWILRSVFAASIIPMLYTFIKMRTSGAYIGLGVSIFILLFLFGILNKNKKIRTATFSVFAVAIVLTSLLFTQKQSAFVQNNAALKDVTALVSFEKHTFKTRLLSWKAALKDFPEHPILGTGHGNYAIIFDKHFDPAFYSLMKTDTYFDRAHNNLIDIASTTGLFGLLTYLSIFAFVAYYLIKALRNGNVDKNEFALLVGLLSAYFIQNLAIFDSFVTYVSLMLVLAYTYWLNNKEIAPAKDAPLINKEIYALALLGLIGLFVVYQYNIKPLKMLAGTINAQRVNAQTGDMGLVMDAYREALSYETGLDRDSRTTFIRLITQNPSRLKALDLQKAREILDYGIYLSEQNLAHNPNDSLQLMEMSQLLNVTATFYANEGEKFNFYLDKAEEAIDRALAASPGRVPVYFAKAQIQLTRGDFDKAAETMNYSISLNPDYSDGYCQLSKFYFHFKSPEDAYPPADKCIDLGGVGVMYPASFVKELSKHYDSDPERAVIVYKRLTELSPKDATAWIKLAQIYADKGMKAEAKDAALKAAEADPSLKNGVENFVRNLE